MWDTSLDLVPNLHGTVREFRKCFGKSLFGQNLLLMIQNFVPPSTGHRILHQ